MRMMDDRPPDVRMMRPGGDKQMTPLEEVAIEASAEDDFGAAALEIVCRGRARAERRAVRRGPDDAGQGADAHPVQPRISA